MGTLNVPKTERVDVRAGTPVKQPLQEAARASHKNVSEFLLDAGITAAAQLALRHAEALARLSGASIILLSIVEEMHYSNGYERPKVYTEQVRPHFLATARALLEKAAKPLRDGGLSVAAHVVESGNHRVSELIVQQAKDEHCDLIILGTHGRRGIDRLLLGSDAEQVARIAPVPVMLVRTDGKEA